MRPPRPISLQALGGLVAERVDALDLPHPTRVAIDGPPWSGLALAPAVVTAVERRSRPVLAIDTAGFLRPASLRFERGRNDPDAFYEDWLDLAGLRREVLDPAGQGGAARVLPSLWDAERDRATRAAYVAVPPSGVVVVSGWFLLGAGLPWDLSVHVALGTGARRRRVPAADTDRDLPAFDRYDAEVRPVEVADIVVRADDPNRPAVVARSP